MEMDLQLLYKLNLLVLTDEIPDQVDVLYVTAQPDGELRDRQIRRAVQLQDQASVVALCGGTGQGYSGFKEWSHALQEQGIPKQKIVAIPYADTLNTRSESLHFVDYGKRQGWRTAMIMSLPHHQLRVFLTMLHERRRQASDLVFYNAPSAPISWWTEVTHYQGEVTMIGNQFIDAEIERIHRYQRAGGLASLEEGFAYLQARDA